MDVRYCLILPLLIMACSNPDGSPGQYENPDDLPLLDVQMIFSIGDSDEVMLGRPGNIIADSEGYFYVTEQAQNHILLFDKEGEFKKTLGREGSGPGEFERLGSLSMSFHDDTLYVYDFSQLQVSVFARDLEGTLPEYVSAFNIDRPEQASPHQLYIASDDRIAVWNTVLYYSGRSDHPDTSPLRLLSRSGETLADQIKEIRADDRAVDLQGGGIRVAFVPFGRKSLLSLGPDDRLYHAWSDQISVDIYDLDGVLTDSISYSLPNLTISAEERREILAEREEPWRSMVRDALPEDKPVMQNMLVDDENRIWINIHTSGEEDANWLIFDGDGEAAAKTRLPEDIEIRHIRNGRLYGLNRGFDTLPEIRVFELGGTL